MQRLPLFLLFACTGHRFVTETDVAVVFRDVRVFDGAGFTEPMCVTAEGGRIKHMALEPCADLPDLHRGGYLLPGLSDMHIHAGLSGAPPWVSKVPNVRENLSAMLYAGVTTGFDVCSAGDDVLDARGGTPQLYATGPMLTVAGGHAQAAVEHTAPGPIAWWLKRQMTRTVDGPEEAASVVAELHRRHVDAIKVAVDHLPMPSTPTLSAESLTAIVREAHARSLRVVAHVGASADAETAVAAGVDALVHGVYLDRASDRLIATLAEKKIPVACTLSVFASVGRFFDQSPLSSIEREIASADIEEGIAHPDETRGPLRTWAETVYAARTLRVSNCERMWRAGVPMLLGSDSANVGHLAGAGTHVEILALAAMGMPPLEVLHTATAGNAEFFNGDFGTIAPGKRADLIWLERDPSVDLSELSRPLAVVAAGRWLQRHPRP